jgi:hypothetical protein
MWTTTEGWLCDRWAGGGDFGPSSNWAEYGRIYKRMSSSGIEPLTHSKKLKKIWLMLL